MQQFIPDPAATHYKLWVKKKSKSHTLHATWTPGHAPPTRLDPPKQKVYTWPTPPGWLGGHKNSLSIAAHFY